MVFHQTMQIMSLKEEEEEEEKKKKVKEERCVMPCS
jgi:hypothetical protein